MFVFLVIVTTTLIHHLVWHVTQLLESVSCVSIIPQELTVNNVYLVTMEMYLVEYLVKVIPILI